VQIRQGKLTAWVILVSVLALLGYSSRLAGGKPPKNAAYLYSTAAAGLFQYALILGVVLLIAMWPASPERSLLALRRPRGWARTLTTVVVVFASVYAVSAIVSAYSDPGREQGLTPHGWDSSRAAPFVVNFVVFVAVAPFVEELTFRGLGYSLLRPLGALPAILWVGLAFGLAHGLLEGLPILIVFGCGLAWLRERSDSVYPGMAVHATFNAIALIAAVLT
jgi:membrane protease YdiL (CAAX protease family)